MLVEIIIKLAGEVAQLRAEKTKLADGIFRLINLQTGKQLRVGIDELWKEIQRDKLMDESLTDA